MSEGGAAGTDRTALVAIALAALAAAAFLRFWGLGEQGITLWDSGLYANVARGPAHALEWVWEHGLPWFGGPEPSALLDHLRSLGVEFSAQKAGHLALMALFFLVLGVHDWVVLATSAVCGLATLPVVYLLGARLASRRAGVLAAAALAASALHVAMSRTGYPQTDTALFFAAGLYLYLTSLPSGGELPAGWRKRLAGAGLLWGISLTMHPSALTAVGLAGAAELYLAAAGGAQGARRLLRRLAVLAPLVLAPLAAVELVFAAWEAWRGLAPETTFGYFLRGGGSTLEAHTGLRWHRLVFFPHNLWVLEGPVFCGLTLAGLVAAFRRFRQGGGAGWLVLAVAPLAHLALWTYFYPTLKVTTVILPLLAVLAGVGGDAAARAAQGWGTKRGRLRLGPLVGLAAAAGLLAVGAGRVWPILHHHTGYGSAARALVGYMERKGGVFALADQNFHNHPQIRFYLGAAKAELPPELARRIVMDLETKGDYLFISDQWFASDMDNQALADFLRAHRPVLEVPHLRTVYQPVLRSHRSLLSPDSVRLQTRRGMDAYIHIYDLRALGFRPWFAGTHPPDRRPEP